MISRCFPWKSRRVEPEDAFHTLGSTTDEIPGSEATHQGLTGSAETAKLLHAEILALRQFCTAEMLTLQHSEHGLAEKVDALTAELSGLKVVCANERAELLRTQEREQALVSENARLARERTDALARVQELTHANVELSRKLEAEREQTEFVKQSNLCFRENVFALTTKVQTLLGRADALQQAHNRQAEIIAGKDLVIESMRISLDRAFQLVEQLVRERDRVTAEYNDLIRTLEAETTQAPGPINTLEAETTRICPITLAPIQTPLRTACGHVFESVALYTWLNTNHYTCPMCRRNLNIHGPLRESLRS